MDTTDSPKHAGDAGGLPPEIADWIAESERQRDELGVLIEGHPPEALDWRPAPSRWSIGEHITHVARSNEEYLTAMEEALRQARERGLLGSSPYKRTFVGPRFVRLLEPPVTRRFKTLKRLIPPSDGPPIADRRARFESAMDRFEALYRANADVDLGRARMRSPFFRLLKFSLADAAGILLAHNRRHLWLMDEVLRAPGFPAGGAES